MCDRLTVLPCTVRATRDRLTCHVSAKDLRLQLEQGISIEEIAKFLCRAGTVDDVRQKPKN
jgi:hypothetical protein